MSWQVQKDARSSAVARQMAERPRRLGVARTKELLATLDPDKVYRVCHLGNRIVVSNAGKRFVLC